LCWGNGRERDQQEIKQMKKSSKPNQTKPKQTRRVGISMYDSTPTYRRYQLTPFVQVSIPVKVDKTRILRSSVFI